MFAPKFIGFLFLYKQLNEEKKNRVKVYLQKKTKVIRKFNDTITKSKAMLNLIKFNYLFI